MLLHVYPFCLLFCDGEKKEGGRDGNDGLLVSSCLWRLPASRSSNLLLPEDLGNHCTLPPVYSCLLACIRIDSRSFQCLAAKLATEIPCLKPNHL
jgi:hypothetical protein